MEIREQVLFIECRVRCLDAVEGRIKEVQDVVIAEEKLPDRIKVVVTTGLRWL